MKTHDITTTTWDVAPQHGEVDPRETFLKLEPLEFVEHVRTYASEYGGSAPDDIWDFAASQMTAAQRFLADHHVGTDLIRWGLSLSRGAITWALHGNVDDLEGYLYAERLPPYPGDVLGSDPGIGVFSGELFEFEVSVAPQDNPLVAGQIDQIEIRGVNGMAHQVGANGLGVFVC